jgi:hypothetical protein
MFYSVKIDIYGPVYSVNIDIYGLSVPNTFFEIPVLETKFEVTVAFFEIPIAVIFEIKMASSFTFSRFPYSRLNPPHFGCT